ncbi:RNase A-like domain-containing protein [Paraburkholderia atlantica]|uniref:RNase A-like domain-containing protein n=1 Tax=Paraburkholderia atlantica TaxID=2654982 RepID=UPI001611B149|nr:RNase A-like domain-containing protein [Paraburkholderia atlantica]
MAHSTSNRLWGGLEVVGGVLEMVGAAALCVLPEPTMASKAGCVVFGVHGSDTASAGLRQIWTGRDTATLTQHGTTKLAEAMKASPDMANRIGLSVDMIVPFGFAGSIKAARAASVSMGRINLEMHEAKTLRGVGGHTMLKHVGRTEAQLWERLRLEPKREVVSSFVNIERAEWAISEVMRSNKTRIQAWTRSSIRHIPLDLVETIPGEIGYGLTRQTGKLTSMNRVVVVLKYETYNGMPCYILTAYLQRG